MVSNYSFIDEHLAGSAKPYELKDVEEYLQDGISNIISLTPKLPLVNRYVDTDKITFHHFPVYATPDNTQLKEFIQLIESFHEKGEKAVVHCEYGQERTGMFLAVYLVELKGMSVQQATKIIQEERPGSLQTHHAVKFLIDRYL